MIWFLGLAAVASCPDHVRGHVDATLIQNLLLHPYLFYARSFINARNGSQSNLPTTYQQDDGDPA